MCSIQSEVSAGKPSRARLRSGFVSPVLNTPFRVRRAHDRRRCGGQSRMPRKSQSPALESSASGASAAFNEHNLGGVQVRVKILAGR